MTLRDDAHAVFAPWLSQPLAQLRRHAHACYRTFIPRPNNNDFRKLMAAGLFVVWAVLTLGLADDQLSFPIPLYGAMTAVVYTVIGIQWGFELQALPVPIEVRYRDTSDTTDEEDTP